MDPADHSSYAELTFKAVKANIQRLGLSEKG
jgi:hypothetical protein